MLLLNAQTLSQHLIATVLPSPQIRGGFGVRRCWDGHPELKPACASSSSSNSGVTSETPIVREVYQLVLTAETLPTPFHRFGQFSVAEKWRVRRKTAITHLGVGWLSVPNLDTQGPQAALLFILDQYPAN